jgi:2-keto-4-pentenoate hydratase/2-oxohepta-3-ene-1,7-dioic acid hydratase in catechol pathway
VAEAALFLDDIMERAPRDLQDLIERGRDGLAEVRERVDAALGNGAELTAVSELRHSSAVLRPAQVIAIGANYAAHASELKLRSESAMTIFSLWPNSLAGHGATTTWPRTSPRRSTTKPSSASSPAAPPAACTFATRSTTSGATPS